MYFTNGSSRAFEMLMRGKPGFDRYENGGCADCEDCNTCHFYRPHWKYQFCVYAECPYEPGKLTALRAARRSERKDQLYFVDKRDKYGGIPNIQISYDLRAFAKLVVKSVPAQQKFAAFFVDTRWRPVADVRNPHSGQNTGASYFGLKPITCHNIVLTLRFRNSHTRTCLSVLVDCNRKAGAFCIADLPGKF